MFVFNYFVLFFNISYKDNSINSQLTSYKDACGRWQIIYDWKLKTPKGIRAYNEHVFKNPYANEYSTFFSF